MDSAAHVVVAIPLSPWAIIVCGIAFGAAFKIGIEAVECLAAGIAGAISGWLAKRRRHRLADKVLPPRGRVA